MANTPVNYDELFPGRFLKAGLLNGRDVTVKIAAVRTEDLPSETGGTKVKGILAFEGKKMELVLNRTNGEAIKAMFGPTLADWIGKRITLYPSQFNGEPCLRVRGSPDIAKSITFELKLPRKRPQKTTLIKTGTKPAAKPAPAAEPEEEPEIPENVQAAADALGGEIVDANTGEVF
jgi:hypothetical protein